MAELKRNFLKAKMNKDLDERLIPNGEYRDALNIEIATSEGSDTGSVQTIKSNGLWENAAPTEFTTARSSDFSGIAQTVGVFNDDENQHIYNFVSNASSPAPTEIATQFGNRTVDIGIYADTIYQISPAKDDYSETKSKVVINDIYEVHVIPDVAASGNTINGISRDSFQLGQVENSPVYTYAGGIRVGMRVQAIDLSGVDIYGAHNEIIVKKIDNNPGFFGLATVSIETTSIYDQPSIYTQAMKDAGVVLKFSAPRVLNFTPGNTRELESNTVFGNVSNTPVNSYISAINAIDNFLLWTDGRNEPKKINIKRCLAGNSTRDKDPVNHTLLVSEVQNKLAAKSYLKESHITVLKPNPDLAPSAVEKSSAGSLEEILVWGKEANTDQDWAPFAFSTDGNILFNSTTNIYIKPQVNLLDDWAVGNVITLTGQTSSVQVEVQVYEVFNSGSDAYYKVRLTENFADPNSTIADGIDGVQYSPNTEDEGWMANVITREKLYSQDFIRFAYRYVYTDNEVSCVSPFSPAVFAAGDYAYAAKDGFNLGMLNNIESIKISNYLHKHTPRDVKSVELIFKSSTSSNLYVFKTIDLSANNISSIKLKNIYEDDSLLYVASSVQQEVVIEEKLFGFTLPSDQLTRNFDAVPKKAVAQEITANRLMYANYTQDYNLRDDGGENIELDLEINTNNNSYDSGASFNSTNVMRGYTSEADSIAFVSEGETGVSLNALNSYLISELLNQPNGLGRSIAGYTVFEAPRIRLQSEHDPGGNFSSVPATTDSNFSTYLDEVSFSNNANFGNYTVPESGYYTIKASARVVSLTLTADNTTIRRSTRLAILASRDGSGFFNNIGLQPGAGAVATFGNGSIGYGPGEQPTLQSPVVSEWARHVGSSQVIVGEESYELPYVPGANTNFFPFEHPSWVLTIPETTVYLRKGTVVFDGANGDPYGQFGHIGLYAHTDDNSNNGSSFEITEVNFEVVAAPSTVVDISGSSSSTTRGKKSVRANRTYNLGVVYRDKLGRESSVLVGKENDINIQKTLSDKANSLFSKIKSNAPSWAETYKYYIKENNTKSENLVLDNAFINESEESFIYLLFNAADKDKVSVSDYLVAKKKQGSNEKVTSSDDRFRVLAKYSDISPEGETQGLSIPDGVNADDYDFDGSFVVKLQNTGLNESIGISFSLNGTMNSPGDANGAVFETESKNNIDLDLYYEASNSYAIRLDKENASKHIRKSMSVKLADSYFGPNNSSNNLDYSSFINPTVKSVQGAISKGVSQAQNGDNDYYCIVELSEPASSATSALVNGQPVIVRFYVNEGNPYSNKDYVEAILAKSITAGDTEIFLKPEVHNTTLETSVNVSNGFPWFNCISFGNGVESDTIRDDFNATELLKYIPTGKISGVRASMPLARYAEFTNKSDIIFSQIYNDTRETNRFNEFLMSEGIVKQINPDYGSIQKLFTRNDDLLTLCEKKCLRVLSSKDALFNADGSSQLLSTSKVLGEAIPFAGDYGISTNPESFAFDEYRCYFTDVRRGAVIRLSKDGITPISSAGMNDFFSDHLINTTAAVGSFDSDKEEYNLTLHEVFSPNNLKDVYTISFNEDTNGWTSFKSYIQEAGLTLNNKYYTFKNGSMFKHNQNKEKTAPFNLFYNQQYDSSITSIFNDNASFIKTFRSAKYEGSQAKVDQFSIVTVDGVNYNDGEYYNLKPKNGWSLEYLNTDLQEATSKGFVDKEGKWFSYLKGNATKHTNFADGGSELTSNVDSSEFSVQGLGNVASNVTLVSGTLPVQGYNVIIQANISNASDADEA